MCICPSILCGAEEWMYAHHLMLLSGSMKLCEKFVQTRCTRLLSRFGIYSMCILPSILSCAEWMYTQGVFISYFNVSLNSCIHAFHPPLFTSNTVQGCWSSLLFRSWSIQNTRIYFQLVFSECQSLFIQMPSPLLY